ncbi:HAF repeat-containing protein [Parafrankia discariae]|uniref:HAF repeat-containing protein n=1 Tax=Parafrankia discariae TaxID=365528 RepID=UPI0003A456D4|nr:HAF repeat-containing protein [Parafrankia discariae]
MCGDASGLLAGLWQSGRDRADGFLRQGNTIRRLPGNSRPIAMSPLGVVVGEMTGGHGRQAFRWSYGIHSALPHLGGTDIPGGRFSTAVGVNGLGLVVGSSSTNSGDRHACLWRGDIGEDLGTLGGPVSSAAAINDLGLVVGTSQTPSGDNHAFVWSDHRMHDLGTLGGTWSRASGVNNAGLVIGSSGTADDRTHAFCWQNGIMTDLGTIDGEEHSEAVAINKAGQVLVRSYGEGVRGFLWAGGGRTEILGFGEGWVDPAGLNDSGVVCGTAELPNGDGHAFRWRHGVVTDLGTLGGRQSSASHVTASGVVLGEAMGVSGSVPHATFWTQ